MSDPSVPEVPAVPRPTTIRVKQDRRATMTQLAQIVLTVVMFGALFAYFEGDQADDDRDRAAIAATVDQQAADRAQARVTACSERVRDRMALNRLVLASFGFDADTGLPTPAFEAATSERQGQARRLVGIGLRPIPICTTEAVEAYYASDGTLGVVPIDGSGDDYSEAITPP